MSSCANDQGKVPQFAAFHGHDLERVAVYPTGPNVLVARLFQLVNNGVIPTAKERSKIFSLVIRVLTYDFHQLTRNFKYHRPL